MMKRPKPGFKTFLKTRIRHPFTVSSEILYKDDSEEKYKDVGSVVTTMLMALYLLLSIVVILNLRLTVLGWILWLALPLLHRFVLRYFWTKFEICEYDFAANETEELLRDGKDWEKTRLLKKAAVLLEAVLVIAIAAGAYLFTDSPSFKMMGEIGYIDADRETDTAEKQYEYACDIADEHIVGAELLWYEIRIESGRLFCQFIFRNPDPGILIKSPKEMIYISFYPDSSYIMWHDLYYYMNNKLERHKKIDFVPLPGQYPEGTFGDY